MTDEERVQLSGLFSMQADIAYSRHRLRYAHREEHGKTLTFVCICDAGFSERRNWNGHIRDSFKEVL